MNVQNACPSGVHVGCAKLTASADEDPVLKPWW